METMIPAVEDLQWIAVEDPSAPGRVARTAADVARRLGFSEHRSAEVAIAATELSTNLHRHAKAGRAVVRIRRREHVAGVEVIAIDAGPGVDDMSKMMVDGVSTGGTLGVGLGAVARLASSYACHSVLGKGTVSVATFWAKNEASKNDPDGLVRSMNGETQSGDAWATRTDGDRTYLLLVDGLGHGELAAIAARAAIKSFNEAPLSSPKPMLEDINRALRPTRGAAAAMVMLDRGARSVTFSGVGNVATWIDIDGTRKGLASSAGIVGAYQKPFKELRIDIESKALIVMHSDGLTSNWSLDPYPGLRTREVALIAATLMRDAGIHHDDASVLVARV
jgi:anti-sigma regulatory factor (Ser/Thr protein kinase)